MTSETDLGHDAERCEIEKRLTDAIVIELHSRFSPSTQIKEFRTRLVQILHRFERGMIVEDSPNKKSQLKHMTKVEKLTSLILDAPPKVSENAINDLVTHMEFISFNDHLERFGWDTDESQEPHPDQVELVRMLKLLQRASREILQGLNLKSDVSSIDNQRAIKSLHPLDQLIYDIQGTLLHHDENRKGGASYYDATSGEYRGYIFDFTKQLLDGFSPKSYFSDAALGQRISRLQQKDKAVKN